MRCGLGGRAGGGRGAAAGIGPTANAGESDRAPAHHAPLRLWCHDLRRSRWAGDGSGAVWAQDHRHRRYLYVGQFLSKKRTATALAELFGTPLGEGTVATMTTRAAGGLEEFLNQVKDRLADAEVVGFDETGLRVAGTLHWVHCARTGKYTLITCHPKRGRAGIEAAGVLGRFRGVAVHDAWAPYDTYLDVTHQLCCAHALRELTAVADTATSADWCWANQAADALVAMQHLVSEAITSRAHGQP
jgi:transposase